ncbi:MAG: SGNH/GDSL hydrolase family protein [Pseudonocardiales bacterium]|nr:SGNH/GDSL hydrolase family protein [Pseudonocardiales bacterium]MBV9030796.1 SGNH/GDSL hydrolase family protein [Pseudonocardiales bacterium]MBW0008972.1 SGNH/GDSL hydrolase family protein [Pseudonocardiales bacterium]
MAVETLPAVPVLSVGRRAASLAVLGDSTAAGVGDPLPGGGWRGFGPLLAAALGVPGEVRYTNLSTIGARIADLRYGQLPGAVAARPDVAVISAGMNDTLRSDFDPVALRDDLDIAVTALRAAGALVLITRFHRHGRVFRLPGPLRRALHHRIGQLNDAIDQVVARRGALCLDLHVMPGAYDTAAWSVDRLHPSERGHRLLASGLADLLAGVGIAVPHPVDLTCADGRQLTAADHVAWLVCHGVPWLVRRGRDLLPHAAAVVLRELFGRLRR